MDLNDIIPDFSTLSDEELERKLQEIRSQRRIKPTERKTPAKRKGNPKLGGQVLTQDEIADAMKELFGE
jgi:cytochrome c553